MCAYCLPFVKVLYEELSQPGSNLHTLLRVSDILEFKNTYCRQQS